MPKLRFKRPPALLVAVVGAVALAACGSPGISTIQKPGIQHITPGKDKPAVTLGDEGSTEQQVLGQLYAQALEARGYTVNVRSDIGSSAIGNALASHRIDLYPAYTGMIYQLAKTATPPSSAQQSYQGAAQFEKKHGLTLLHPTLFQDVDRVLPPKPLPTSTGCSPWRT